MVKGLGFILLVHDQPANAARLVNRIASQGGLIAVHWDAKTADAVIEEFQGLLEGDNPDRVFQTSERMRVEWGEWSIVAATLEGIKTLANVRQKHPIDHVTLLSGHDYPLRPLSQLRRFLDENPGIEHIECDTPENWAPMAIGRERYLYRHHLNWRKTPKLFGAYWKTQKFLGWRKKVPSGLTPRLGAQWWTLSWGTIEAVTKRLENPKIYDFFRHSWIPDELVFQSLVYELVPHHQISGQSLTFYIFSKRGTPIVWFTDRFDYLKKQPHFFTRKINVGDTQLRDQLDQLCTERETDGLPHSPTYRGLKTFYQFQELQRYGIPNRRVMGLPGSRFWGDMQWNRSTYFVVLVPQEFPLAPIGEALNRLPGVHFHPEPFHPGKIDYAKPELAHPFYPESAVALRDVQRVGFLYDLLQHDQDGLVGFGLRIPSVADLDCLVAHDPCCLLWAFFPSVPPLTKPGSQPLDWEFVYDQRTKMTIEETMLHRMEDAKKLRRQIEPTKRAMLPALTRTLQEYGATELSWEPPIPPDAQELQAPRES